MTVEALSDQLQVSRQTIRKDLNDLCDQGLLNRVHGGGGDRRGRRRQSGNTRRGGFWRARRRRRSAPPPRP
ncbi:DeoR family transcriptional regulator [Caulobacter segnis]